MGDERAVQPEGLPERVNDREIKFPFGPEFQLRILAAILRDGRFSRGYLETVRKTYFDSRVDAVIAQTAIECISVHRVPPARETLVEILREQNAFDGEAEARVHEAFSVDLEDLAIVREKIVAFGRRQALSYAGSTLVATIESLDAGLDASENDIDAAVKQVSEASRFGKEVKSKGYWLVKDGDQCIASLYDLQGEKFITGIRSIDQNIDGGIDGDQVLAIAGGSGKGKSLFLNECGIASVRSGKFVGHVTLELSPSRVLRRYYGRITNIPISRLTEFPGYISNALAIIQRAGGDLRVQAMPAYSTTVSDIRDWISRMEDETERKMDVLVIDASEHLTSRRSDRKYEKQWEAQVAAVQEVTTWVHVGELPPTFTAMQLDADGSMNPKNLTTNRVKAQSRVADLDVLLGIEDPDGSAQDTDAGVFARNLRFMKNRNGPGPELAVEVKFDFIRGVVADILSPLPVPDEDIDLIRLSTHR